MTITDDALTLLRNTGRIRQRPDAADILAAITEATRDAQRVIDRPPPRVYAGPCPHCQADLLGQPGRAVVYCRTCGEPSIVAERQEAMRAALEDHLGNARYASRACTGLGLPITEERIRQWVHRGKLTPRPGFDHDGNLVKLLRIGDVIDLALAQRARLAQR